MRLPDFHPMVLALVDKLGLKRRLFFNVDINPESGNQDEPLPTVVYTAFNGSVWHRGPESTAFKAPDQANRTWIATNGQQTRRIDYADDPRAINEGFNLPNADLSQTTDKLLDAAFDSIRDYYRIGPHQGKG
jgi:monoamine oxidase